MQIHIHTGKSFPSAAHGRGVFSFIYNIRKCFGIYFCFLREFAIFYGIFSVSLCFYIKKEPSRSRLGSFPLIGRT